MNGRGLGGLPGLVVDTGSAGIEGGALVVGASASFGLAEVWWHSDR